MRITQEALEVIHQHGSKDFPNESCGFLYGEDGSERIINRAQPVINSKEGDKRRRFKISPIDYMRAEQFALKEDIQLLGIYHSHPGHPAIPSEHDRIQAVPFFSYIITSVMDGIPVKDRSWLLNEKDQFEEEEIETLTKLKTY